MTFLDIARRIHRYSQSHDLPVPRVTLTFETSLSAVRFWNIVVDEFPEQSLNPANREFAERGEASIHGVPFRIEPLR